MSGLKLLVEEPTFEIETVIEEKNNKEPSNMYIKGVYMLAEKKNKNGRIYNLDEMITEAARYTNDMILKSRSLGELNHPTSVEVNPERAAHMVTELKQDNKTFIGKSKVLNTPMGHIVRSLLMDGVKLGISTRALGKLTPKDDHNIVSGFHLICCDIVHDPSVDIAFVDGILESKEWAIRCDGSICEVYNKFEEKLKNIPKCGREEHLKNSILELLNALK